MRSEGCGKRAEANRRTASFQASDWGETGTEPEVYAGLRRGHFAPWGGPICYKDPSRARQVARPEENDPWLDSES